MLVLLAFVVAMVYIRTGGETSSAEDQAHEELAEKKRLLKASEKAINKHHKQLLEAGFSGSL